MSSHLRSVSVQGSPQEPEQAGLARGPPGHPRDTAEGSDWHRGQSSGTGRGAPQGRWRQDVRPPGKVPRPTRLPEGVCVCVCVRRACTAERPAQGLAGASPWGRKTSGSASWGPSGCIWARMSRMERQGTLPGLPRPQGLAPAEGSG